MQFLTFQLLLWGKIAMPDARFIEPVDRWFIETALCMDLVNLKMLFLSQVGRY